MHLNGQQFSNVLEKFSFTSSFYLVKSAKNYVLEDKWFLSKMFYRIKMQDAPNWSSHFKKHQTFESFQMTDFYAIILKITFFRDF